MIGKIQNVSFGTNFNTRMKVELKKAQEQELITKEHFGVLKELANDGQNGTLGIDNQGCIYYDSPALETTRNVKKTETDDEEYNKSYESLVDEAKSGFLDLTKYLSYHTHPLSLHKTTHEINPNELGARAIDHGLDPNMLLSYFVPEKKLPFLIKRREDSVKELINDYDVHLQRVEIEEGAKKANHFVDMLEVHNQLNEILE